MSRQRPQLILFVCAVLAVPAAAQQDGVRWQHDLESAKLAARQSGKLVLVHFWTPSCAPCLMLDQNVFNQPGVAGALDSQFVPVKLNANENAEIAMGFGITRVPTDVIVTPDGQVVGKLISPPTPGAYVAEVSKVAAQHVTKSGQHYAKAIEAAPMQPQLNAAYANLQIAPNTLPAVEAQKTDAASDRYALPAAFGVGQGGAAAPSWPNAAQSGATAPWPATTPPVDTPQVAPQPMTAQPPAYDQYAQAPAMNATAPTSVSPSQIANPYAPAAASTPGAVVSSDLAAVAPQAQVAGADATSLPPNAPPVGFEGFCPVSMRAQWKWVPGDPRWGIVHRGRTYYFAGQNEQQQFWADPDRFSPALSGMDPVLAVDHRQQVPGKREHSIDYDNLFYMFASEATLQQFTANPERYAASVRQAMGIQRGRLVR